MRWSIHAKPTIRAAFLTGNIHKFEETSQILAGLDADLCSAVTLELQPRDVSLDELQCVDVVDVVRAKAQRAYDLLSEPVLVEDTGLSFEAWGRLPGALVKWFLQEVGNEGLLRMLSPYPIRRAVAETCYGLCLGSRLLLGRGVVHGEIAHSVRGESGFGWDAIFVPSQARTLNTAGLMPTLAELSPSEKNRISPRRAALADLLPQLAALHPT